MRAHPRYLELKDEKTGFVTLRFRDYSPTAHSPHLDLVIDPIDAATLLTDLMHYEQRSEQTKYPSSTDLARDAAAAEHNTYPLREDDPSEWKQHKKPTTKWTSGPTYDKPQL